MSTSTNEMAANSSGESVTAPICECGLRAILDTSYTVKNPYRRFLCCPKYQGFQHKFFLRVDPWRPQQVDDISSLDGETEREKVNMWIDMYHQVVKEKDYYEQKAREKQAGIKDLDKDNKSLNKTLFTMYVVISTILIFLLALMLA